MNDARHPALSIAIAELVEHFGARAVKDEAKRHKGKPGRPETRKKGAMDSDEFLVWLTVERYKIAHPKASDQVACESIANSGGVGYLTAGQDGLSGTVHQNSEGLRRLYSAANKMRRENAHLASAWNRALDDIVGREHKSEDMPPRITGTLLRKND